MERSQKEHDVLRAAERALESDDTTVLKNSLLELLNMFQKLSRRIDKIFKQSDKQQEALIHLNEELCATRDKQADDIKRLVEEQKKRASAIIESRKRLYELHRTEVSQYKSNVNELTTILIEKEELEKQYKLLQAEYNELKSSGGKKQQGDNQFGSFEISDCVKSLKSIGLEKTILALTKEITKTEIIMGEMNNTAFTKNFFKILNTRVQTDFLKKQTLPIPVETLSLHIIKSYAEDILCVVADTIIESTSQRNHNALQFLSYYDGGETLDSSGDRFKKPDIIDRNNNRWIAIAIAQIYIQREKLLKQLEERRVIIKDISDKVEKCKQEIESSKRECKELEDELEEFRKSEAIETMRFEVAEKERMNKINAITRHMYTLEEEINGGLRAISTERARRLIIEENLSPLEEKYEMILTAVVKAMLKLISKK